MCRTYKDMRQESVARARAREIDRAACAEYALPADDRIAAAVAAWDAQADDVGYFYVREVA